MYIAQIILHWNPVSVNDFTGKNAGKLSCSPAPFCLWGLLDVKSIGNAPPLVEGEDDLPHVADDHAAFHRADAAAVVGVVPVVPHQEVVILVHGECPFGQVRNDLAPVRGGPVLPVPGDDGDFLFLVSVQA